MEHLHCDSLAALGDRPGSGSVCYGRKDATGSQEGAAGPERAAAKQRPASRDRIAAGAPTMWSWERRRLVS